MTVYASKELIQKSVRLPADIVEYIEAQEGKGFTDKMTNLLYEVMNGDERRRELIEEYDRLIQERRIRLGELSNKVNGASVLVKRLEAFCTAAEAAGLLEEPKKTPFSQMKGKKTRMQI